MNQIAVAKTEATNLPAIIDRARSRLAEARTSAEVLEAKAIAESALHYAKRTKAANETHANCLRMIVRAEMRMADDIDRGQNRGAVASQNVRGANLGNGVRSSDTAPATFDDLGLDRRRVAEWRKKRDAGEAVVEGAIQTALAEGRAPTKSDISAHVRGTFGTG